MINRSNGRGYTVWRDADGTSKELDNFTCCHCNKNSFVDVGSSAADMGGWCFRCTKAVCKLCATGPCIPFEKRLEAMEARERSLKSILGY